MDEAGALTALFREEAGRVLAVLIRLLGDFDRAEDAQQAAFAEALTQWPKHGWPANPAGWLVAVGRRKAIDGLRRRATAEAKSADLALLMPLEHADPPEAADAFGDDLLRLLFTCCHPALVVESQMALALRTVCGLSTAEIARAFLVREEAMAQRLQRTKAKIRQAGIPYGVPEPPLLAERLAGVLGAIYLLFTEGYAPAQGEDLTRPDLSQEAIRLGRLLVRLMPGQAEGEGLLALMLLHDARRSARAGADGEVILLADQDRSLWNRSQIAEGAALVETSLRRPALPGSYAVQAAIASLHALAPTAADTDWRQITGLYSVLMRLSPSPVVALNHAVAVAMVDGPARGLDLIAAIQARGELADYHLLPAARADLLARLGRMDEAAQAYRTALQLTHMEPERRFLNKRLAALVSR